MSESTAKSEKDTAKSKAAPKKKKRKTKKKVFDAEVERLVFFGTPEFALTALEEMVEAGYKPQLVVSQPARPVGRGKELTDPPVAAWAKEQGLPVAQPDSVKDEAFLAQLEELEPDLAVVVAFGQFFPNELLELPESGCINVHASLLPKLRGASPIQGALIAGEKKTGISTMVMNEELDAGPILLQDELKIGRMETAGELEPRMAQLGAKVLLQTLEELPKGIKPRKQKDESATYAGLIIKTDGKVNWALHADELFNRMRAYDPWPGMSFHLKGRPVKLVWGTPIEWEQVPLGTTGTYLGMRQGRLAVLCGNNTLFGIERLQRPGKKAVSAADFANGERLRVGERFA